METDVWRTQKRAIWKVLPVHPQPQPLEALSSYLTRVAAENGLWSIFTLGKLAGGVHMTPLQWRAEYPAASYQGLSELTMYPQERWVDLTLFPLLRHFGRATTIPAVRSLLVGSLAESARYCPLCLTEYHPSSYSLLWRFLLLPGCMTHEVYLLDRCGHCESVLPLLGYWPLHLTTCPRCQGDLRTSASKPLSFDDRFWNMVRTRDIQWLLTSKPRYVTLWRQVQFLGEQFQLLRRHSGLSIPEVARRLGRETRHVWAMEAWKQYEQATFRDYLHYADLLGCRLIHVFLWDRQTIPSHLLSRET